ncbi:hypothetical protein [Methylotenera sp.]|uniref:hypothetical protein n=1 Tax=Methylotenera sp. TaxID=2051956 RepID=UPI0024893ED7|nr:hypothetical protein [Methylotenera sp.]MDI1299957.1 hypothetical protein [Methylotenera sp.]
MLWCLITHFNWPKKYNDQVEELPLSKAEKKVTVVKAKLVEILATVSELNIISYGQFKLTHKPLTIAAILQMAKH